MHVGLVRVRLVVSTSLALLFDQLSCDVLCSIYPSYHLTFFALYNDIQSYKTKMRYPEMMSCDYCRKLYHPTTCHPPLPPNSKEFRCTECQNNPKRTKRVACGHCSACKRDEDCMTCVVCVQKMEVEETGEGSMKRSKCIFRKCQSWGTGILERDDGEGDDDEEVEDNHDANCYTCEEGGGTFRWL